MTIATRPDDLALASRGRAVSLNPLSFAMNVVGVVDNHDGTVTVSLTNNAGQKARIKYRLLSDSTWTIFGTLYDGNESHDITVADGRWQFLSQPYDEEFGLEGPASLPVNLNVTSVSESLLEQVMEAVVAELNDAGITDSDGTQIVARKEIPPNFRNVKTACFIVFPDGDEMLPNRSKVNEYKPRVNVALCEESTSEAQRTNELRGREQVLDMFVGSRLDFLSTVYCTGESSPSAVDLEALWEQFKWVSVVTLEFDVLRARA